METDNRIRADLEKFNRHVARKHARFERERSNNQTRLSATLGRALGAQIPKGAAIGIKADGSGMVEWPDPPQATPAPGTAAAKVDATLEALKKAGVSVPQSEADEAKSVAADLDAAREPLATITPMPTNGALAGAAP